MNLGERIVGFGVCMRTNEIVENKITREMISSFSSLLSVDLNVDDARHKELLETIPQIIIND